EMAVVGRAPRRRKGHTRTCISRSRTNESGVGPWRRDPVMKAKLVCVSFLLTLVTLSSLLTYASFEGEQTTAPLLPRVGSRDGLVTVTFLDVGQGDAILIRSPEGKLALIDSGPSRDIVENLWSQGIRAIDLVVVTHQHGDHYGGMAKVIEAF